MPIPPHPSFAQQAPLLSAPLLLLDGGLGTTLSQPPYNITFSSDTTPLWSSHLLTTVSGRATLLDVQRSFVQAGSQVLLTVTYQGSLEGFARTRRADGVEDGADSGDGVGEGIGEVIREVEARGMMRGAVGIAREAFEREGKGRGEGIVALSLGAYGATLVPGQEYEGNYGSWGEEELVEWHRRRLEVFFDGQGSGEKEHVWADVAVVAFETLPRLDEVRAVRRVMTGVDRPFWVSCVFPGEKDGEEKYTLPDGKGVRELVAALLGGDEPRPWGIGINCTKIWKVRDLIVEFEQAIENAGYEKTRLVLYPDGAGDLVYDTTKQEWLPADKKKGSGKAWDEDMTEIATEVTRRGKWNGIIIGGCCMTGPEQIAALKGRVL
jgi:homocysteine S-methyltransferase